MAKVRVGVDANVADELLVGFPAEVEFVRLPRTVTEETEVDFWIVPFARRDAQVSFAKLRGVKVIQSMMAGVDWVLPWLPRDVTLCDGRGVHDISASEWVMAAVLSTMKRFPLYRDQQREQQWKGFGMAAAGLVDEPEITRGQYPVLAEDLSGKTVLIVGYGSIGAAVEARMTAFGVNLLRVARSARTEPEVKAIGDLHGLLPLADIVVLVVPLTPETKGLIGAAELALMKQGALLVNAARGPVVVTEALVEALKAKHIRAVLDVTDPEPLPVGHALWTVPNCMITPHVGGSTPELIRRSFQFGAKQVRRFCAGEPLENVVGDAGY